MIHVACLVLVPVLPHTRQILRPYTDSNRVPLGVFHDDRVYENLHQEPASFIFVPFLRCSCT